MALAIFKTCQSTFCSEVLMPPIFSYECRGYSDRTADNKLPVVRTHPLGCDTSAVRSISSGLFRWIVFPLSACAAVGDADSRVHLFADGQCEHQRGGAQLHSQSVLPLQASESHFWSHTIHRLLLLADDVRRRAHAASQGEFRSPGRRGRYR